MGNPRPRISVPAVQLRGADDVVERVAVDWFMRAVREVKRKAIQDLADDVPQVFEPGPGRLDGRESQAFRDWAESLDLRPLNAVSGWAMRTKTEWRKDPEKLAALDWSLKLWVGSTFTAALYAEYPNNLTVIGRAPIEPLEAFPEMESREAFAERARRHWDARVDVLTKDGRHVPTRTIAQRNLIWLARFQVGGENYNQISKTPVKVKQETVKKGIAAAARVLRLELRPAHPRGRPRKR